VSDNTALFIPWLQDPVRERNHALFLQIKELERQYEKIGVPIINPVEVLSNSIKSRALEAIARTGLRTARVVQIDQGSIFEMIAANVGLPFIVRNDQGHGGYVRLVQNPEDFQVLAWDRLPHPIALEFIDTRSEDGLFRKYRYLLTGDTGISRHIVISKSWCVHAQGRVHHKQYIEEELKFVNSENPYHDQLNKARQALGIDYVAFDYSLDQQGNLIVWEPNPFPTLWAPFNARDSYFTYQKECIDKVYSHILRYYLERASIPMTASSLN
jgi:glutathione synthase/RimK-type ligase-like ATP-grasp enzyme